MKPADTAAFNYFAFNPTGECAQRVAEFEDVAYNFPDSHKNLFDHVNVLIRKGDGVAVVGPNGAGKTTFLRLLIGELEASQGRIKLGSRVKIGYFPSSMRGCIWSVLCWRKWNMNMACRRSKAVDIWGLFSFMGMRYCG